MLLKFNLNDLQIKTFDEFIIVSLSTNLKKQKIIYTSSVVGTRKSKIIRTLNFILFFKRHSHDMLKISTFIASALC